MAGYCAVFPSWPSDTRSGLSADSDVPCRRALWDVEFAQHPWRLVAIGPDIPGHSRCPTNRQFRDIAAIVVAIAVFK